MLWLAILFSAIMIGNSYGNPTATTEGPALEGGTISQLTTQLNGCCFTALQAMLNHVASRQNEWDACEKNQLEGVADAQKSIENKLKDLQVRLSNTEGLPEAKTNVVIPPNFEQIGSKFYYIENSTRMNWHGASNACRQMGAHLARIESSTEQYNIEEHLKYREVYWLDTHDLANEGEFVHSSSGQPAKYLNWGYGEPDNYENFQHCIFLYNGYYYDSHCNTGSLFICQAGN
ncbi:accessory gland protein Acp29AB-like [Drosophila eugracilis]|uniref:accessory gland protein Acp29AB-like n=1 Tax=Drosophila eugracilis TaxID=29029 RepID=UPI001BD9645B|nr:accessory gland protein Acp29AB-like [Drosophila eugracilis]